MRSRAGLIALAVLAATAAPAAAQPEIGPARWSPIAQEGPQPPSRRDTAVATVGERYVYLFGGRTEQGARNDLWVLDLERDRWRSLDPAGRSPAPRFGHNLATDRSGRLLLFGGQAGNRFFSDVWRFTPATRRWRRISRRGPTPRYGAAGALDPRSGRLIVSHGFTHRGRFDDTWSLGGRPRRVSGRRARPLARCLVGGIASDGGFFLFGGQSNPRPFLDDLWRLNLRTRRWRRLSPTRRPSPRNLYASAQVGDGWLLHGGATANGDAGDLWRLDLNSHEFVRLETTGDPGARSAHAAATVPGGFVIFGGVSDGKAAEGTWRLAL